MQHLTALYQFIQANPLYWQAPLAMLTSSGIFEYFKHKLELEGKKKITGYLTLVSGLAVMIHLAIIGATFAGPAQMAKIFGGQTVFFLGGMTLVYNFLTHGLTKFLQDAQARAAVMASTPATPAQKNPTASQVATAADAGVAQF